MTVAITLLLALLAAIAGLMLWRVYLRIDMMRLEMLSKWSSQFYGSAQSLLDRDGVPDAALKTVAFWNNCVAQKSIARDFVFAFHQMAKGEDGPRRSVEDSGDMNEFFARDPEGTEIYVLLSLAAIMTVSYRSCFWGFAVRAYLSDLLADHQPKRVAKFTAAASTVVHPTPASYAA